MNELAPFSALSLGRLFENTIAAIIASAIGYHLFGAGILGWLLISLPVVMSLDFAIGTLSHSRGKSITIPGRGVYRITNPSNFISKILGSQLMGGIFAGLFIVSAMFHGAGLPIIGLNYLFNLQNISYPLGISIFFIIVLMLCGSGSLSRIGRISRWSGIFGLTFFLISLAIIIFFPGTGLIHNNISNPFASKLMPVNFSEWSSLITSLGIYWSFIGAGGSKVATMSGTIRTDFSAKAGLATMATAPMSVILVAPVVIIMLESNIGPGEIIGASGEIYALFIITFILLSVSGISGWAYSGRQTMIYFFVNFRYGIFLVLMGTALVLFGVYIESQNINAIKNILFWIIVFSAPATILVYVAILLKSHTTLYEWNRYQKSLESQFEVSRDLILLLFHIIPKNLISRVFGWISYIHMPKFIRVPVITTFAKVYAIDTDESEGELKDYPSLNKFFTRALRDGIRLIAHERNVIVSPVDGKMSQFGKIKNGSLIQAKGMYYSTNDLLAGSEFEDKFNSGNFCVMYLSPQDYHRIHNPERGNIVGYSYHPGQLFPVNSIMVKGLSGLFPKNERLTTFIQTKSGMIAVIKVGATNVGRISVTYDSIRSNSWFRKERHVNYQNEIYIERGQELGRFEMGSTVILLIENHDFSFLESFTMGSRVRYGQILGKF